MPILDIINMMHDVLYEEILENGESRNYLEELQIITEEFRKYLQNPDPNSINMEQLEVGNAIYQMLWDSAQEIGLGKAKLKTIGLLYKNNKIKVYLKNKYHIFCIICIEKIVF